MSLNEGHDQLFSDFVSAISGGTETGELLRRLRELIQNEPIVCDRRDESLFMLFYLERMLDEPRPSQAELRAAVSSAMYVFGSVFIPMITRWSEVESIERSSEVVRNATKTLEQKVRRYGRRVGGAKSGGSRRKQREEDLDVAACALNKLYAYSNRLSPTLDDIASQLVHDQTRLAYPTKGGWHQRVRHLSKKTIKLRADKLRD